MKIVALASMLAGFVLAAPVSAALDPAGVTLETSVQGRANVPGGTVPVSAADHLFTAGTSQAAIGGSVAIARGGFDPYPAVLAYSAASIGGAASADGVAAYSFRYSTFDAAAAQALRDALDVALFSGGSPVRVTGIAQLDGANAVDSHGLAEATSSATVQAARGGEGYFSSTCAYSFGCGTFHLDLGASLRYSEDSGLYTFDGTVSVFASASSADGYTAFAFADPEIHFAQSFLDAHPGIGNAFSLSLSDGVVNASGPVPSYPSLGGPVPEPASWAMMVGGFGLIGGAMRRRVALTAA